MHPATIVNYARACTKAAGEASDLRREQEALTLALCTLIRTRCAKLEVSQKDIDSACRQVEHDVIGDLFHDAISSAESASEDGSYADREHDGEA